MEKCDSLVLVNPCFGHADNRIPEPNLPESY